MLAVQKFPLTLILGYFSLLLLFFLVSTLGDLVEFGFVQRHVNIDYLVCDCVDCLVPVALLLVLGEAFHYYRVAFLHILRH